MASTNNYNISSTTTSMAPSSSSSFSRVPAIGGPPRSSKQQQQQPAAVPIFVAEKLFDEFSLGRINARPDVGPSPAAAENVSIGGRHESPGFQPSAPPFECIGRSAGDVCGFDIFGGVPGIRARGGGEDDVFAEGKNRRSAVAVAAVAPSHQRSASSPSVCRDSAALLRESDRLDVEANQVQQGKHSKSDSLDAEANQFQQPATRQPVNPGGTIHSSGSRLSSGDCSSSSNPLPNTHSTNGRGIQASGPHGSSRLRNSGTADVKVAEPCDRANQSQPPQQIPAPPYVVKPSPLEKSPPQKSAPSDQEAPKTTTTAAAPATAAATPTATAAAAAGKSAMPSWLPSVANCSPRLKPGSAQEEATSRMNKVPVEQAKKSQTDSRFEDDREQAGGTKERSSSAGDEVLLPKEDSGDTAVNFASSSPRKARRLSTAERLKAALFPDFGRKEDKDKSGGKAKSWFTVGDVKLVTQPTDVPPPDRAPPDMEQQASGPVFRRDERWRRNSCEFPLGKTAGVKEKASSHPRSLPQADREDFNGLSSSVTAMKEAVERAEARVKHKQKSAEVFPETTTAATVPEAERRAAKKVPEMVPEVEKRAARKEMGVNEEHYRGGDLDKRVVERGAHELREKALKKTAEREAHKAAAAAAASASAATAAGRASDNSSGAENGFTSRSTSAPKQRVSDEAERSEVKAFFSGEQCKVAKAAEAPRAPEAAKLKVVADEEKRQRRNSSSEKILEERAAKVLAEKNQRELNAQQEQAERQRVSASVEARIKAWAAGKEGNLRALLLSLQEVLWEGSGWQALSAAEVSNEVVIKKAYRRATLCVHPDKVQQRSTPEKLVAEKVFDLLMVAWNRFNSHEAFFFQVS